MERERLTALAVTFLLLSSVRAGEIKTHEWPVQLDPPPIEVTEMPVLMDIGCWVSVKSKPQIALRETSPGTYTGCTSLPVLCNTDVRTECHHYSDGGCERELLMLNVELGHQRSRRRRGCVRQTREP